MNKGKLGIFILIGAVLIIVGSITLPFLFFQFGGRLDKATGQVPVTVSDSCITPLLPRITDAVKFGEAINAYIKKTAPANSPLQGLGSDFVAAGSQFGVNPAWVVNIARKESSFGTAGWPAKNAFNAYGRTATASQPGVQNGSRRWYLYASYKDSIYGQSEYLQNRYLSKGLTTFEKIVPVYAPPSENDTEAYIKQIKDWVGQVMTSAGSAVTCGTSTPATPTPPPTPTNERV